MNQYLHRISVNADLRLKTALHIGSGKTGETVDSPVLKDFLQRPFIPGSSIKGAMRSHLERLLPTAGLSVCQMHNPDSECPGSSPVSRKAQDLRKELDTLRDNPKKRFEIIQDKLCPLCLSFGSSFSKSRIFFRDAHLKQVGIPVIEVRDGVGIDRDSNKAVDGVKYDFEVISSYAVFKLNILIEDPDNRTLGIFALGMLELINGHIPLGGLTSRGFGQCYIDPKEITIMNLDLSNPEIRKQYFASGKYPEVQDPIKFLREAAQKLLM